MIVQTALQEETSESSERRVLVMYIFVVYDTAMLCCKAIDRGRVAEQPNHLWYGCTMQLPAGCSSHAATSKLL